MGETTLYRFDSHVLIYIVFAKYNVKPVFREITLSEDIMYIYLAKQNWFFNIIYIIHTLPVSEFLPFLAGTAAQYGSLRGLHACRFLKKKIIGELQKVLS